jgi:Smg protein
MFDVLVYLFENYLPDACPEPAALARKLAAAGFADGDIGEALDWLAGLAGEGATGAFLRSPRADSQRIYDEEELAALPAECRGFLAFLEQAGAIDAQAREVILERATALAADREIPLEEFKVIVLMVVWRRQIALDTLILEELLDEGESPLPH